MNTKDILNSLKRSVIIFILLFTLDFIVELFQINQSGTVVTLFGVVIKSEFTSTELLQTFSLNYQIAVVFMIILLLNLAGTMVIKYRKSQ